MNLNQTIEANYNKWVDKLSRIMGEDKAKDVLHSVILSLYDRDIPDDYIRDIDSYIIKSAKLSAYSPNGQYRRMCIKENLVDPQEFVIADIEDNQDDNDFDIWKEIDDSPFSWWEKEVFKRKILEDKTLQELADETNLSLGQVYYSFCKVRNYLKNKLK